ncbi:MAG TPA: MerR family transcriptional regulator [Gaiellaceae bacterium]|nr:MerR family transcriptional regulator [Gaiellaceae bacterium]
MSVATTAEPSAPSPRLQTIGAVCRRLKSEFPDISISKIRYLEDQGLLTPRRTQGGYRLFGEDDVDRLETILRLQRDEFLPLRVIKQELATSVPKGRRRQRAALASEEQELSLDELCARAGITAGLVRDLEGFGLLEPTIERGERHYRESDAEVAALCAQLAGYGMSARHLRTFQTSSDRNAALLGQITAPALHARSLERRQAGIEDLRALGELTQELSQLLLWRALRRLAAG